MAKDAFMKAPKDSDIQLRVQAQLTMLPSMGTIYHPVKLLLVKLPEPALQWFYAETVGAKRSLCQWLSLEGCLKQFCALHNASDERILEFAQRWGVLGIWPHRHDACPLSMRDMYFDGKVNYSVWNRHKHEWFSETTEFWRSVATHFRTLLNIGALLQRGQLVPIETWQQVLEVEGNVDLSFYVPDHIKAAANYKQFNPAAPQEPPRLGEINPRSGIDQAELEIQKYALMDAVSRLTINAPIYVELSLLGKGFVARPFVHIGEDCSADKNDEIKEEEPELYRDTYQKLDLRKGDTWNGSGFAMRPSLLLNNLAMQLVAALTSPLGLCTVCQKAFTLPEFRGPRSDRATLCGDQDCARRQAAARKREKRRSRSKEKSPET